VVETIFPAFGFGDVVVCVVTIVFAIGLVPTLVFAWAFELTPEGLKKESEIDRSQSITLQTGKKLDRMIMVVLALAFDDMSLEGDQEYLSDGITERLLNLLAKIPELRMISRSSAFSYKGKDVKLIQIAEELNVAHILEGSVQKAGNRVRITTQLIEARSDTHLWSETYDRTLEDVFAIQDEIASAAVEQLRIRLLGKFPSVRETDPEAYALYLQA